VAWHGWLASEVHGGVVSQVERGTIALAMVLTLFSVQSMLFVRDDYGTLRIV
jgi:hypothetical protein